MTDLIPFYLLLHNIYICLFTLDSLTNKLCYYYSNHSLKTLQLKAPFAEVHKMLSIEELAHLNQSGGKSTNTV